MNSFWRTYFWHGLKLLWFFIENTATLDWLFAHWTLTIGLPDKFNKKDLSVSNMRKSDEMTLRFVDNGWHSTRPHGVSKSSTRASIFNYVGMSWITWCFATRLQSNSDFLRGIDHVRSQLIPMSSGCNIQLDTCLKAQKLTLPSDKIDALEEDVFFETDIVRFQQFVFWACYLVWTWKWWMLFVSIFCLVDGHQMTFCKSKNSKWTKTRRFKVFFGDYATQLCVDSSKPL